MPGNSASVSSDVIVPIQVGPVVDKILGNPVIGSTSIKAKIRRVDGLVYDWSDDTFKVVGSVIQLLQTLTEVDDTNFPGEYETSLDLSVISNPNVNDTYFVTIVEDGTATVAGLPTGAELRVEVAYDNAILARKLLENNQDLSANPPGNLVLFDDDGTTPLRTWSIKDIGGADLLISSGTPAIREKL